MKKTYSWFRKIAFAEGVSFLLLLFVAMPLKYLAGLPMQSPSLEPSTDFSLLDL
jgi:hypothetical protein